MFPILTLPAFQRTAFTCQNQVGPIIKPGFHRLIFYLIESVLTVPVATDVESVELEVAFPVASTLVVAFSVEEFDPPHEVKAKIETNAKTFNVFILGLYLILSIIFTYIDLRFTNFIYQVYDKSDRPKHNIADRLQKIPEFWKFVFMILIDKIQRAYRHIHH